MADVRERARTDGSIGPAGDTPGTSSTAGTWTFATFRAETGADVHADVWELHEAGDELLSVASGRARVHLRPEQDTVDGPADLVPGTVLVIPRGRWHRIELLEPSTLIAVTARAGTRHTPVTEA